MIVAAHQPAYLPWLGYLAKIAACDLFVVMDDLQYEAQNFQNRNRIKINHGAAWLTVPLERGLRSERICDKYIANAGSGRHDWRQRSWRTLQTHYGSAPYWPRYADALHDLYHRPWHSLVALDLHILSLFMRWFEIRRPLMLASSLGLRGHKTERILDLCRVVEAEVYLSGSGASRHYLDAALLARDGVTVAWQTFRHPVYPQRYPALGFLSHLSALDLLLNCGPASAQLLREAMMQQPMPRALATR